MLGRYIAMTLVVLGGAMVIAPEGPQKPEIMVARASSSPAALVASDLSIKRPAVIKASAQVNEAPVVQTGAQGVEAAVAEALALDATEESQDQDAMAAAEIVVAEPTPTVPEVAPIRYLFVTGKKVNVRSGPSTDYPVVGAVVYGDPVELVDFEGESWARIRIDNGEKTGFMSRKFLAQEMAGG